MKRDSFLIFALWALLFLTFSCGGRGKQEAAFLCRLDSLVEADADSALRLMGQTQSEGWPRRDAMRLELLRAKAMNRADSLFTTDSLMLRVAEYYRSHGSQNDRMLSLYLLGCTYRDMGAAPRAIDTWQQAVAEADTTRQDCDLSTLMRIHSQMGRLFRMQHLPEYEKEELEQAEALCWRMRDTISAIAFEQASCHSLFNEGDYKGCIERAQDLYERYMNWGLPDKAAKVVVFCVKSYIELSDYVNAKKHLDIYESYCLSEKDHRKINGGLAPYYIYKGNYYLGIGNIDSAEYCFRQAMPEMHMLHNDVDVYYRIYQIYERRNQPDSMFKYAKLFYQAEERKANNLKTQATADARDLYDYSVEQRIAKEITEVSTKRKVWLISVIWGTLFLVFFFFLHDLQKRRKYKYLRQEYETKMKDLISARQRLGEAKREKTLILKKREKEKSQDQKSIDEYEEKILHSNRVIQDQSDEIQKLRGQVEFLGSELAKMKAGDTKLRLEQSEIVIYLKDFLTNIKPDSHVSAEKWQELEDTVNMIYPSFYSQMHQNCSLSKNHYRVCMLTLADFSSSDINTLLDMKSSYTSTVKIRLLKTIYGSTGKAGDFEKKIRSFAS